MSSTRTNLTTKTAMYDSYNSEEESLHFPCENDRISAPNDVEDLLAKEAANRKAGAEAEVRDRLERESLEYDGPWVLVVSKKNRRKAKQARHYQERLAMKRQQILSMGDGPR